MKNLFEIFKPLIDLLFPIECLGCGKEGVWLCQNCLGKIKLLKNWHCPVCKINLTEGEVCSKCQPHSYLDGAIIAVSYEDDLIDKAIHCLKYKGIKGLFYPLSGILTKVLRKKRFWDNDWILVPVPLHKRRERWRGFNQTELIAKEIGLRLNLEVNNNNLYRTRYTYPQVKLTRQQRLKNIVNAFQVKNNFSSDGCKKVILLDDVMTTGATLQECAKVLKESGASKVWAVVLARGR